MRRVPLLALHAFSSLHAWADTIRSTLNDTQPHAVLALGSACFVHLRYEFSSSVKSGQLPSPGGPEQEAITHDAVNRQSAFQVTEPPSNMAGPRKVHHAP